MRRENNTSRNLKLEKKYKKMKEKYYFDDDLEMGGRQE
jgi:hypothetical protein